MKKWTLICETFTILCLISGGLGLAFGQKEDTHLHMFMRFAFCAIAIGTIGMTNWGGRFRFVASLFHYLVAMFLVFAFTWATKFVEPLHPNAFRDVFFNFTIIYIIVAIALWIAEIRRRRRDA